MNTELLWQNSEKVNSDMKQRFEDELAKLGHLQIHAAMMQDSVAIRKLAAQQEIVYFYAKELAYQIKN